MNKIDETGLTFGPKEVLTAAKLNTLNDTINALVRTVNSFLSEYSDVNQETLDYQGKTLSQAIATITEASGRRKQGMLIKFLEAETGAVVFYTYTGTLTDDSEWGNTDNWKKAEPYVIDGGEW